MSIAGNLTRALGLGPRPPRPAAALYARALELAREPSWFAAGGVADTLDGRFAMLAHVMALLILRLQALGLHQAEADVTDRFAADMDASLREVGVGDLSISKQVGATVGALGGRISALRSALADGEGPAHAGEGGERGAAHAGEGGERGAARVGEGGERGAALDEALARNLYAGAVPSPDALAWAHRETRALAARFARADAAAIGAARL